MCGRFAFYSPKEAVEALFGVGLGAPVHARWNIAPGAEVLALRQAEGPGVAPARLHWGLVPFWAKDPAIGQRMINARLETLAEKPAFRQALARRRCVILADGFYEWRTDPGGKTPCYIHRRDGAPMALAGLWERWERGESPLETCTIVTLAALPPVRGIHDRMPAILDPVGTRAWIGPLDGPPGELLAALAPLAAASLECVPVGRAVNNPRNEGPDLVRPASA